MLGSFLFTGDDVRKPAGVLSGGKEPVSHWPCWWCQVRTSCCWTNPPTTSDPASREEILAALRGPEGAVVLVSHGEGAVAALNPERVLLLPDGVEDHWNADYGDLIVLA